ncbi:MAG TPA: biopolymer transporter ExbD [Candidatus Latescibacteria bacterium]|jgi:biopolymer transport protein ExbD|nr:biopolymer transporter ExbD [Candidatus Latescibacterota bacterium]|tara:strand:- start:1308 stop:1715 length:408 start_codon:yes stop_codon:yes gene_type:complete
MARISQHEDQELNLTPMIDCVFLLLIFFMVTTVFKQPYNLQVELPEAQQALRVQEKKLVSSITADGTMEINRELVTLAQLPEVLMRHKQETRSLTLIVRTDKGTKHKFLLDLLEVAKGLGIEKVVLATEDKELEL